MKKEKWKQTNRDQFALLRISCTAADIFGAPGIRCHAYYKIYLPGIIQMKLGRASYNCGEPWKETARMGKGAKRSVGQNFTLSLRLQLTLPIESKPHTNHIPTTYQPYPHHMLTISPPHTDHIPNISSPHANHITTTSLVTSVAHSPPRWHFLGPTSPVHLPRPGRVPRCQTSWWALPRAARRVTSPGLIAAQGQPRSRAASLGAQRSPVGGRASHEGQSVVT